MLEYIKIIKYIIANNLGKRVTPSYVCYKSNTQILVGEQAKDQIIRNIKNTIYDTKRLIGRNYSDKIVQNDIKLWSFTVKSDEKDKPIIEMTVNREKKIVYPEQVASQILRALKKDAEDFLGKEVKDAIITVPAYFTNSQRQSTIDAGKIAGLNVIRTINEPTAAAIAYGLENKSNIERKVLIFDFGGGTFDITIMNIKNNNKFEVITSDGDSHLGGEDIDSKIAEYCLQKFKENEGIEVSSKNQKALKRLKKGCIEAKHLLSTVKEANITIESLSEETDLNVSIDRTIFNELCKEIFERCINLVIKTLKESNIEANEINEVVLAGGSSKIPKIQEMLEDLFGKDKICKTINPDEAIAQGAAIYANQFRLLEKNLEELEIADIVPHSLGVKIDGELMDIIIPKNTKIPCKIEKYYENVVPYQDMLQICIYEGDSIYIKDCFLLDNFFIQITPRKESLINVIFEIEQKFSILKISAEEINGQSRQSVQVTREKRNNAKIKEMIRIEEERRKELVGIINGNFRCLQRRR